MPSTARLLLRAPPACALLAIALYAVTLGGTFIYDDLALLVADKRVGDPHQWYRYWTEGYNDGIDNLYRPLVSMTYAVQHWLHGGTAWPYHLFNVLLHAVASGTVAWFATKLATRSGTSKAAAIGWISGLLFAVHPVHVEAVANVVGRAELMCAIGTLGAIGLSLDPLTPRRVAAIGSLFLLALLSKEQGMLVPAMVGIVAYSRERSRQFLSSRVPEGRVETSPSDAGQKQLRAVLFLLLTLPLAVYVVLKETVLHLKFWWERGFLDPWIQPLVASTGRDRMLAPFSIVGHYFELLVAPYKLRIDYGGLIVPGVFCADDPYFWIGVAAALAWVGLLVYGLFKRDRFVLITALLFGLLYALVGNLFSLIGVNMAERLMYLPSAFFLMLVARMLVALPRRAVVPTVTILVVLCSIRAVTYAYRWNDRLAFYEYQVRVEPRSMKAILLAVLEHEERGELEQAERYARLAIDLQPTYDDAWLKLAAILIDRRDFDGAQNAIDRATSLRPEGNAPKYEQKLRDARATTRPAG